MSETSTMEPPTTDAHEATTQDEGHGKHRGPVSGRDDEATPHGRHRKPSDQQGTSA
ncbi:hypothetical protein ACFV2U_54265 [Streptomyces sp. NPDC059697]|uniref:hypothetical protein n=1 Tax=Streptomyces sp. NPDC059697 TaxID=3346912 RepID=UPI003689B7D2